MSGRQTGSWGGGGQREVYVRQSLCLSFVYLVQWLRQPFFGRVRWLKQICLSLIVVVVRCCCCSLGPGSLVQVALGSLRWAFPHNTHTHTHTYIVLCCQHTFACLLLCTNEIPKIFQASPFPCLFVYLSESRLDIVTTHHTRVEPTF